MTKIQFEKDLEANLSALSKQLMKGDFKFSPLRPILIPKSAGGNRVINVPTIRDRFVQRVLLQFLIDTYGSTWKLPFSFGSMGEESTKTVLDTLTKSVPNSDWIIRTDISKYFDSIDRSVLKTVIKKQLRHPSVTKLLNGVIDCEHSPADSIEAKAIVAEGIKKGRGLRQGMTLSPLLAFLFLRDIDEQMPPGSYFRYVDDIVISGKTKSEVVDRFTQLKISLVKRGLNLHDLNHPLGKPKTILIEPRHHLEFLGIGIRRAGAKPEYIVSKSALRNIEEKWKKRLDYSSLSSKQQANWVPTTTRYISDFVRNYESSYRFCSNWTGVRRRLEDQQREMVYKLVNDIAPLAKGSASSVDKRLLRRLMGVR